MARRIASTKLPDDAGRAGSASPTMPTTSDAAGPNNSDNSRVRNLLVVSATHSTCMPAILCEANIDFLPSGSVRVHVRMSVSPVRVSVGAG